MWPWSTIRDLRCRLQQAESRIEALQRMDLIRDMLYRTYAHEIRGAHKGIRRLVEKLKRARQGKEPKP